MFAQCRLTSVSLLTLEASPPVIKTEIDRRVARREMYVRKNKKGGDCGGNKYELQIFLLVRPQQHPSIHHFAHKQHLADNMEANNKISEPDWGASSNSSQSLKEMNSLIVDFKGHVKLLAAVTPSQHGAE